MDGSKNTSFTPLRSSKRAVDIGRGEVLREYGEPGEKSLGGGVGGVCCRAEAGVDETFAFIGGIGSERSDCMIPLAC